MKSNKPWKPGKPWIAEGNNLQMVILILGGIYILWMIFTQGAMPPSR